MSTALKLPTLPIDLPKFKVTKIERGENDESTVIRPFRVFILTSETFPYDVKIVSPEHLAANYGYIEKDVVAPLDSGFREDILARHETYTFIKQREIFESEFVQLLLDPCIDLENRFTSIIDVFWYTLPRINVILKREGLGTEIFGHSAMHRPLGCSVLAEYLFVLTMASKECSLSDLIAETEGGLLKYTNSLALIRRDFLSEIYKILNSRNIENLKWRKGL